MPEIVFMGLFFASVASVPIACFAVAALFHRAGFHRAWTICLCVVAGAAILGTASFSGIFGGLDGGPSTTGIATIFISAILVTLAAVVLAFRKWPVQSVPR